jgi:hypothetical protein
VCDCEYFFSFCIKISYIESVPTFSSSKIYNLFWRHLGYHNFNVYNYQPTAMCACLPTKRLRTTSRTLAEVVTLQANLVYSSWSCHTDWKPEEASPVKFRLCDLVWHCAVGHRTSVYRLQRYSSHLEFTQSRAGVKILMSVVEVKNTCNCTSTPPIRM